jgi:hypothetical protein
MAPAGHNGNNETNIGKSQTMSMKFLDGLSLNEVNINNLNTPIKLWIAKDPILNKRPLTRQLVNATNLTLTNNLLLFGLGVNKDNVSAHIELKPANSALAYLFVHKYGQNPTYTTFDSFKILCPGKDSTPTSHNELIYRIFISPKSINGFKGQLVYGVRELDLNEHNNYCINNLNASISALASNNFTNFTDNFEILSYLSGCYYIDTQTGKWSSSGMEILEDSNTLYTHCLTEHLTEFAGGLVVLPSAIDFNYVFAHASIADNPIIYAAVVVMFGLYALVSVLAFWMDRMDAEKMGITLLEGRNGEEKEKHFYEIVLFTGSKSGAETDSKVEIMLFGDKAESGKIKLEDSSRRCFRNGGIDTFILPSSEYFGLVNYLRIKHDNSGKGSKGSWYLSMVIVKDLQTNEKSYFICEKWLALEKDDGLIDRILPVSMEKDRKSLKYLLKKQARYNLNDGHLWLSVFKRPIQTSFSKLDRTTCCFVLLFISMLFNIIYYDLSSAGSTKDNADSLRLGPFLITKEQVFMFIF